MRLCSIVAGIMVGCVTVANAQPIDDETLRGMMLSRAADWQKLEAEQRLTLETVTALNQQLMAQLDLPSLTIEQIQMLAENNAFVGIDTSSVMATIDQRAAEPTGEGVRATILKLQMTLQGPPDAATTLSLLEHPGTPELLREDAGAALMQVSVMTIPEMSVEQRATVYEFLTAVPEDVSNGTLSFSQLVVSALAETLEREQLAIHQAMVAHLKGIAATRITNDLEPADKQGLERLVAFLDGNFAQGKLIGAPMPRLDIVWSSDETLTSFDALRGKVIVLDFWATWCGPCISSFPNVRQLQQHYEGHDVIIVGVTSVQGQVVNGPDGRVLCQTNEAEFVATEKFMEFRSMTWPVVFTEQNVFNPAYGVSGIPHVTIIDSKGIVRASGLHPASPLDAKTAIIDGLLQEAGLSVPQSPEGG